MRRLVDVEAVYKSVTEAIEAKYAWLSQAVAIDLEVRLDSTKDQVCRSRRYRGKDWRT